MDLRLARAQRALWPACVYAGAGARVFEGSYGGAYGRTPLEGYLALCYQFVPGEAGDVLGDGTSGCRSYAVLLDEADMRAWLFCQEFPLFGRFEMQRFEGDFLTWDGPQSGYCVQFEGGPERDAFLEAWNELNQRMAERNGGEGTGSLRKAAEARHASRAQSTARKARPTASGINLRQTYQIRIVSKQAVVSGALQLSPKQTRKLTELQRLLGFSAASAPQTAGQPEQGLLPQELLQTLSFGVARYSHAPVASHLFQFSAARQLEEFNETVQGKAVLKEKPALAKPPQPTVNLLPTPARKRSGEERRRQAERQADASADGQALPRALSGSYLQTSLTDVKPFELSYVPDATDRLARPRGAGPEVDAICQKVLTAKALDVVSKPAESQEAAPEEERRQEPAEVNPTPVVPPKPAPQKAEEPAPESDFTKRPAPLGPPLPPPPPLQSQPSSAPIPPPPSQATELAAMRQQLQKVQVPDTAKKQEEPEKPQIGAAIMSFLRERNQVLQSESTGSDDDFDLF